MTDYVKSTNFASKDSLAAGNPLKIVKGTEIDTEFNNIATAVSTKADLNSPALIGTPTAPTPALSAAGNTVATVAAIQALYPVGSIYINAGVTTNPGTLLGFGTWVAFGAGRVMVGQDASDALFDTLEETGGSKNAIVVEHNHFGETGSQLVNHNHNFTIGRDFGVTKPDSTGVGFGPYGFTSNNGYQDTLGTATESANHSHNFTTSFSGSSGTNANVQPYIVVKMWKRTA